MNWVVVLEIFIWNFVCNTAQRLIELNYLHANKALFFQLIYLGSHGEIEEGHDLGCSKRFTKEVTSFHESTELVQRHKFIVFVCRVLSTVFFVQRFNYWVQSLQYNVVFLSPNAFGSYLMTVKLREEWDYMGVKASLDGLVNSRTDF